MSISVILRFIGLDRGDVAVMLSIFFLSIRWQRL